MKEFLYAPIRWTIERERENVCNRAKLCQASEMQVNKKNNLKNKQTNKQTNQLLMLSVYIFHAKQPQQRWATSNNVVVCSLYMSLSSFIFMRL